MTARKDWQLWRVNNRFDSVAWLQLFTLPKFVSAIRTMAVHMERRLILVNYVGVGYELKHLPTRLQASSTVYDFIAHTTGKIIVQASCSCMWITLIHGGKRG